MVDGKLVEGLHVEEARRMLALQRNIEASQARSLHPYSISMGRAGRLVDVIVGNGTVCLCFHRVQPEVAHTTGMHSTPYDEQAAFQAKHGEEHANFAGKTGDTSVPT